MGDRDRTGNSVWDAWAVVAHRCGGARAPENSLAGLERAAESGFATVEFDVMLSADGVPMLIHDDTLDRTTFDAGPVAARSAAALSCMAINRGWGDRFPLERMPTLGEALAVCRRLGLVPNIEIKPSLGRERETGLAAAREAAAAWAGAADLPLLSSFSEDALAIACEVLPAWPAALLVEQVPVDWRTRLGRLGASSLHCHHLQGDWAWLEEARRADIAVRCYTVDDPVEAAHLRGLGILGVFSDCLDGRGRFDRVA